MARYNAQNYNYLEKTNNFEKIKLFIYLFTVLLLLICSFPVLAPEAKVVEDDEELPFDLIFQEQPSKKEDLFRALIDNEQTIENNLDNLDNEKDEELVDLDAILADDIDDKPEKAKPEETAKTKETKEIKEIKSLVNKAVEDTVKEKQNKEIIITNIDEPVLRIDMPEIFEISEQLGLTNDVVSEQDISQLEAQAPSISHQTLNFFASLVGCTNGSFFEKNTLEYLLGPKYLNHNITGEQEGFCQVVLQTPDNRYLQCSFSHDALREITSGYFIDGVKGYASGKSDIMSINVEMTWSRLKSNSCHFRF